MCAVLPMVSLFVAISFLSVNADACRYSINNYGAVDLSPLSSETIEVPKQGKSDYLLYTPCKNSVTCEYSNDDGDHVDYGMAAQIKSDDSCNGILAKINCNNVQPILQTNGYDEHQLIFTCPDIQNIYSSTSNTARRLQLTFICDLEADPYSDVMFEENGKDESNGGKVPLYFVSINTKYACQGQVSDDILSISDGLSGGWIFIIITFCLIITYCTIGYIINASKSKNWSHIAQNAPHLQFWKHVPRLVKAGCIVSFEYLKALFGAKDHGLITTDGDDVM